MNALNSVDERLIEALGKNGRQSSEVLAKQLRVSSATVRRRIKKLTQGGLLRIVAVVDPKNLGFPLAAIIAFNIDHEKVDTAMKALASRSEVKWVSTTTGRFDIIVLAWFASTDELSDFCQRQLAEVDGIRESETFICLEIRKGRLMQP